MSVNKDSRGFIATDPVLSVYGGGISVGESSSAEYARIWVFAKSPKDMNAWFEDPDN